MGRVGQQHHTMACAMMGTIIGHCEALGGRLHLIMSCSISALRACRRRLCMHMRYRKRHRHTGVAAAAAGAMARALYDLVKSRNYTRCRHAQYIWTQISVHPSLR